MNTIENNKLLAEFLGWRKNIAVSDGKGRYYDFICPDDIEIVEEHEDCYCSDCGRSNTTKFYLYGEDLLFHKDWNWLMLVVDKIDKTELSGLTFAVDILNGLTQIICYGECKINGVVLPSDTTLLISESKSRIESTYNACIEFIKWYNENKNN